MLQWATNNYSPASLSHLKFPHASTIIFSDWAVCIQCLVVDVCTIKCSCCLAVANIAELIRPAPNLTVMFRNGRDIMIGVSS